LNDVAGAGARLRWSMDAVVTISRGRPIGDGRPAPPVFCGTGHREV
jgi:hypothetical protein